MDGGWLQELVVLAQDDPALSMLESFAPSHPIGIGAALTRGHLVEGTGIGRCPCQQQHSSAGDVQTGDYFRLACRLVKRELWRLNPSAPGRSSEHKWFELLPQRKLAFSQVEAVLHSWTGKAGNADFIRSGPAPAQRPGARW
jgi:hypothetical protein